jgi:hypothetical protein
MDWIDVVKQRRAKLKLKLEPKQKPQTEKLAEEAAWEKELWRMKTKAMDQFERSIKRQLPAGVEIVDVFWRILDLLASHKTIKSAYPPEGDGYEKYSCAGPGVRVDLGNGVRLDLMKMTVEYMSAVRATGIGWGGRRPKDRI